MVISDFMKSIWFMLYDIVSITAGKELPSASIFCQVSGFFLAIGIEASDAAVFLIALHWTVYIFWPNRAGGESGLYPYRHSAYAFFAIWSILMASLPFVDGIPAYVNSGQSCYLPLTPLWYRAALSWIPRYINLLAILVMYGSSYIYIRRKMNRYSKRSSDFPVGQHDIHGPPTPPLMSHGLIPSSPDSSRRPSSALPSTGMLNKERSPVRPTDQLKMLNTFKVKFEKLHVDMRARGPWSWPGFESENGMESLSNPPSGAVSPCGMISPGTAIVGPILDSTSAHEIDTPLEHPRAARFKRKSPNETPPITGFSSTRPQSFYHRPLPNTVVIEDYAGASFTLGRNRAHAGSQVNIFTMLQQGPLAMAGSDSGTSSPIIALDQETFESGGISRTRGQLRRQLRYLFLYPAVYACIWVFPFISDMSIYNKSLQEHGPFWVLLCSLISLSVQGLANSLVFYIREKPWRHLRGSFRENVRLRYFKEWDFTLRKDSGRTREEMFKDSQRARSRRDEELERENEYRGSCAGKLPRNSGIRNWWDADMDGSGSEGYAREGGTSDTEQAGPSEGRKW